MEPIEYRRMGELEERHWWFRAKRRLVYALLQTWSDPAGGTVLDVGCGAGATLRELPRGYRAVGLDASPEALAICREKGLTRLVQGGTTEIPVAGGSADAVLALDVVEHVEDDVAALREIARVLSPRGIAILTVPAHPFLWSSHDEALHHKRRYTRRMLEQRLARAGLAVRVGGYTQASAFPFAVLWRLGRRWLAGAGVGAGGSDVREVPQWVSDLAYCLTGWEVSFARLGRLPVGLSLVYVVSPAAAREAALRNGGGPPAPRMDAAPAHGRREPAGGSP